MRHDPTRKRLVGVQREFVARAQSARDLVPLMARAHRLRPAIEAFEGNVRGGETRLREQRGSHAVLRRAARMKALRIGSELHLKADRLRGCDADGPRHM